jgi:hypothetical protein
LMLHVCVKCCFHNNHLKKRINIALTTLIFYTFVPYCDICNQKLGDRFEDHVLQSFFGYYDYPLERVFSELYKFLLYPDCTVQQCLIAFEYLVQFVNQNL